MPTAAIQPTQQTSLVNNYGHSHKQTISNHYPTVTTLQGMQSIQMLSAPLTFNMLRI